MAKSTDPVTQNAANQAAAKQAAANAPVEEEFVEEGDSFSDRFMEWARTELVWYAGSFTLHMLGFVFVALTVSFVSNEIIEDAPAFDEAKLEKPETPPGEPKDFEKFDIGDTKDEIPPALDVDPNALPPAQLESKEEYYDESSVFEHRGGGVAATPNSVNFGGAGGFSVIGTGGGPKIVGKGGGVGSGVGTGKNWGSGGSGFGFGGRGSGHRKAMVAQFGGTQQTERAVTGALIWLANHQMPDGSWSLNEHTKKCRPGDRTCTGTGAGGNNTGGTAMGLLPFLAAGQTHKQKGPYQAHIAKGLYWLCHQQKPDGDLTGGSTMYCHGLAAIALCEAYGLTQDKELGARAQMAIKFIVEAQNQQSGGWRYKPKTDGDTSVVGWQVMALKSAEMAGLIHHSPSTPAGRSFELAGKWLDSCAAGPYKSQYGYAGPGGTPTMTAVGLLCRQYLGAQREDQMMVEGVKYLQQHPPKVEMKNIYYYYYATQVMHNVLGPEWDDWNRKMRRLLVDTQHKTTSDCANGSWDPAGDGHGSAGGRVMATSLACLTLEIYYRYLPLYKLDKPGAAPAAPKDKEKAKDADAAD